MKPRLLPLIALFLSLGTLTARASDPITIAIDPTKTGAPISPYIYGQFIEHMGRCIYGGIWAEILEDRKFHFPITEKYAPYRGLNNPDFPGEVLGGNYPVVGASPWQIIGEASGVMMQKGGFANRASPKITAGQGLRQLDLGLIANLRYDGYIWVRPLTSSAEIEITLVSGPSAADRAAVRLPAPARISPSTASSSPPARALKTKAPSRFVSSAATSSSARLPSCPPTMSAACAATRSRF